eukprot:735538-Pleurochrysis_carterae.AAC.1
MTWCGKACPPRRRCLVASGSSNIVKRRRGIGLVNKEREVVSCRRVVFVEGRWNALREVRVDKLRDVFLLLEQHAVGVGRNVYVE